MHAIVPFIAHEQKLAALLVHQFARLRIAGPGLLPSEPFTLPAGRARVALKASGSTTEARIFGWVFVGAGALYIGAGATVFALGANAGTATAQDRTRGRDEEILGPIFAASSLIFLIPGLLVLHHDGTTVTTDAGETLAPTRSPQARSFSFIPGGIAF